MENKIMPTGNKLKTIRQNLRISQAEMAALMGITQSHYSNLESGKKNIAAHLIVALFDVIKVSPSWFFKEEGNIFSESISPKDGDANISDGNIYHTNISHSVSPTNIPMEQIIQYCVRENSGLNEGDIKQPEDVSHLYQKKAVRTYYQLSDRALENRIAILKREHKELYNDYFMLIEAISHFKLGRYSAKFEMPTSWSDRISKIEKEMTTEYSEVEDGKLKLVFYILEFEDEIDTIKQSLHMVIIKFNETSKFISKIQSMPELGEKDDQI